MFAKLIQGCYGAVFAVLGFQSAFAAPPAGLREALAEFETGALTPKACAADHAVGSRNEISRFQILPGVWRQYSTSRDFHNPQTAWNVAERILNDRERAFREATQRQWDLTDIYLMWNAPGLYRRANWNRGKVSPVVLKRAQRFANLMQARSQPPVSQAVAQN